VRRAIAKRLNAEGITGTSGGPWGPSTIYGNARRGTGILNNKHKNAELAATIKAAEKAQHARPLLHPGMKKLYREWVIEAREGLRNGDRRAHAMAALRRMVEQIVLTPKDETLEIVLKGDLAAMLAAASPQAEAEDMQRQVKMVAGGGFEPPTFGL
jgi:hypothetical protein